MLTRIVAPASYVQGPDIIANAEAYASISGTNALVLGGETAIGTVSNDLHDGLGGAGVSIGAIESGIDVCTFDVIETLASRVTDEGADLVVGVGGGVALDTAKAVAERTKSELAILPTIASTDAPCSSVAVVYDNEGGFAGYVHRQRNPELVLVDTEIIAQAPVRFLQHGIGDAFATRFEAELVARTRGSTHVGEKPTDTALTLARRCFDNISNHGPVAIASVERDAVTPSLERIVETNTLLSGVGFESGGLAIAHAYGKGFSKAGVKAPHGLIIAFGTIAQLVLENREPAVLWNALDVARSVGVDKTLEELNADNDIVEIAEGACGEDTTMTNLPFQVTPVEAANALRTADEIIANGLDGRRGTV